MRMYRPAGEKRVRLVQFRGAGTDGAQGDFVVEVDAGITAEEWHRVGCVTSFFDAERIRVAIVQTIAAEVGARLARRKPSGRGLGDRV